MASTPRKGRAGAALPPPPPSRLGRGLDLAPVLVEDPGLDGLHRLAGAVDGPEVVEVLALGAGPESARREGDVELPVRAAPDREPDEAHPGERAVLEVDLGLGDEPLGPLLPRGEVNLGRPGLGHRSLLGAADGWRGRFSFAGSGLAASATSFDLPPARRATCGEEKDSRRGPKAHLMSVATTGTRREQA